MTIAISCARIPAASVELNEVITQEIDRMHQLNRALTRQLFEGKKEQVSLFIKHEYSPEFIARSLSALKAAGYNVNDSIEPIVYELSMQINKRELDLIRELEVMRDSSLIALDEEYYQLRMANGELHRFLKSAAAVEKERKEIYALTNQLLDQRVDLQQLEKQLSNILLRSGEGAASILEVNRSFTTKP